MRNFDREIRLRFWWGKMIEFWVWDMVFGLNGTVKWWRARMAVENLRIGWETEIQLDFNSKRMLLKLKRWEETRTCYDAWGTKWLSHPSMRVAIQGCIHHWKKSTRHTRRQRQRGKYLPCLNTYWTDRSNRYSPNVWLPQWCVGIIIASINNC